MVLKRVVRPITSMVMATDTATSRDTTTVMATVMENRMTYQIPN